MSTMWKIPNIAKNPNCHIREDEDCSIYYMLDYLPYKVCPNKGCNTIWGAYKGLENT